MIRVALPHHLRTMARVTGREVAVQVDGPVTPQTVIDALEVSYPMLKGTIRDHGTKERRAFLRYFACGEDISHESPNQPLPEEVASGEAPFMIVGAIAGG